MHGGEGKTETSKKLLQKAGTLNSVLNKLSGVNAQSHEAENSENERKEPPRKMNINDWVLFSFLIGVTVFGVVLSLIEFSYYRDSVCTFAKEQIPVFWVYAEIVITTT